MNTLADASRPGVRRIIDALATMEEPRTPERLVEVVLEHLCRLQVDEETLEALLEQACEGGDLNFDSDEAVQDSEERILRIITLAVSAREFQFE